MDATKKKKGKKGSRKYKFKVPEGPSKSAPPGPAYSPQPLTWTRFVQYYANLTRINNDFVESAADHQIISTNDMSVTTIFGFAVSPDGRIENKKWNEGKHKKHQGKQPRPEPHPNEFVFEVEYDTKKDKGFSDLTVRRWVEYARKIGSAEPKAVTKAQDVEDDFTTDDEYIDAQGKKHKHKKGKKGKHHKMSKQWFTFVKRAFVGTLDSEEIKSLFGGSTSTTAQQQQQQEESLEDAPEQETIEL